MSNRLYRSLDENSASNQQDVAGDALQRRRQAPVLIKAFGGKEGFEKAAHAMQGALLSGDGRTNSRWTYRVHAEC